MSEPSATTHSLYLDVGITNFWTSVRQALHVALLLDYDGTLAPFHVDRLKAIPLDGVADALHDMQAYTDTFVALVSGRPISEILALMPDPGVTIIGTHGFEVRPAGDAIRVVAISDAQTRVLDRAAVDARAVVGPSRIERKVATVAAHFRGMDDHDTHQSQSQLHDCWLRYADQSAVEIRQFNGGLEMRALGRHKGIAVAEYLETCPYGTLAVYVGDDDTDEDAFEVLSRDGGYGIRVGEKSETTAAQGSLSSCDDVLRFLQTWITERRSQ